jgi:DNA-binding HxlR family transcriptional regulator
MSTTKHKPGGCPMDALLRLLMGPWTTYILWVLRSNGPTRFGELKRKVPGISAKMLTERLRLLEESAVILRHYEPTIPPQVTYSLAPRGHELGTVLDTLNGVALKWREEDTRKSGDRSAAA